ncbi:MAG TPA: MlaD family protein [Terriglobales bacterium]|jgi:phospholipid/cholesterol/gamma-HCH transport system substrate-binding protein
MPGRADLKWSQLKVGTLVAVAAIVLVFAIFAMTGDYSWFRPKLHLITYVSDAGGMRPGADVNLEGVAIGNVTRIRLANHPPNPKQPVEVEMSVAKGHERWLRTDSKVELGTAGPLGETLVNIAAGSTSFPPAEDGTVLPGLESTGINALLVSTHSLLDNANLLEQRIGDLLNQIQDGKGSVGQLLYSTQLYDRFNGVANNLQTLTNNLNQGKGTAGKLLTDQALYDKVNTTLDNVNQLIGQVQHGNGSAAKLLNDPALYDNANQLIGSLKQTVDALNSGQGAIGALLTNSPTSSKLKDSLDRLDAVVTDLQAGKGSAGMLLHDPALYNNLNDVTKATQSLLQAIKANPKKYLTIHLNIF